MQARRSTRILMAASAFYLGGCGFIATMLPQETLIYGGVAPNNFSVLVLQMGGAAFLGFGLLNWFARGVLIGGIYARPVALGNFLLFVMTASAIFRTSGAELLPAVLVAGVWAAVFAIGFGAALFRSPVK